MYIVLLLLLIVATVCSLYIYKREVLSPGIIVPLMFILCGFLGLIRWNDWKIYEYSLEAVALLMLGIFSFLIGTGLPIMIFGSKVRTPITYEPIRRGRIEINAIVLFGLLAIGVVAIIVDYYFIKGVVSGFGFSTDSITKIINHMRNISCIPSFEYSTPILVKVLYWWSISAGVFTLFVLMHNICFRVFNKKDLILLGIVICWMLLALLNSHRSYILLALSEIIYLLYFFLNMYTGKRKYVNRLIFKLGVVLFAAVIALFLLSAVFLGRRGSFKELDVVDYITQYVCSGIRNFDLFIKNPIVNNYPGSETFSSLYRTLAVTFDKGVWVDTALEFRYIDELKISNIYTPFRRYYSDFGIIGITLIPFLWGLFFQSNYEKIQRNCAANIIDFRLIFFVYVSKELFHMPLEETILNFEICLNGAFKIAVILGLYLAFKNKIQYASK